MFAPLQYEELARLKHEELLAQATQKRQFAHLYHASVFHLPALFHQVWEQGRQWLAPQRPIIVDGVVAASRHQAC